MQDLAAWAGLRFVERDEFSQHVWVDSADRFKGAFDVGDAVFIELTFRGHALDTRGFGPNNYCYRHSGGSLSGMRKARRFNYSDGPKGDAVGSGGECSGLSVDAMLNQWQVVGFHFDADRGEALHECGFDGGA